MLNNFFLWSAELNFSSPLLYGLLVIVVMALTGIVFSLIADLVFYIFKIDLGSYKKEYEDSGGMH